MEKAKLRPRPRFRAWSIMHARLDRGAVKLLTRTGLDWTHKYPAIARALAALDAWQAYLDGELCGVGPDGVTSFNIVQLASDRGNAAALFSFLFDLLYLDGEDLRPRPLIERKERLRTFACERWAVPALQRPCQSGRGRLFTRKPAPCASRASSRNASMRPIRPPRPGLIAFSLFPPPPRCGPISLAPVGPPIPMIQGRR